MTIRYECEECGSVLKIKDELGGTDGKCPKCKRKFVVPEADAAASTSPKAKSTGKAEPKPKAAKPAAPAPKRAAADDDDFDPADFLMEGNDGPARPSAGLGTPEPAKPAPGGRKPISAPPGAARIQRPIETGGGSGGAANASANAHDLLTKAAGDSRAKSSTMPNEAKGPKYDFSVIKYQLKQIVPYGAGAIAVVLLAYWIMDYMTGDRLPLPALAAVTGSISYDGKPMSGVKVILSPITADGKSTSGKDIRLRSAVGVSDDSGFFRMEYLPGVAGAPLGKVKVFMEPLIPTPDVVKKIPPKFLGGSAIVEVREVGNTDTFTFNFAANK